MAKKLNPDAFNDWIYETIDDYTTEIEVYYGGAGSGKSYGAMQKMLLKAMNDKRKVLIIRKVGNTLKDSVFSLIKELLIVSGEYHHARINKSDYEIELINGSVFLFKGLDDQEKIKSINGITDIVVEEATELIREDFDQLRLRLRPTKTTYPQIYLMFNPISKVNWVYEYFFINKPKKSKVTHTNYLNNRFLPKKYIDTLEEFKTNNPAYYRIYALGEFATLDKLIFPNYDKKIIPEEEVRDLPLFVGLDFGYANDPSALVWGRYDEKFKIIYLTGEYYKKGMLNNEIAEKIKAFGLSKEIIIADCSRPESIDELRLLYSIGRVKGSQKGADSVLQGIQFVQQHKLVIDERCPKFIEELDNYTWVKDKKTGEYVNRPIDTFNHGIDALRYAMEVYSKKRTAKVLDYRKFGGIL